MVQTLERIETQVPEVAPQRTVKEVGEQLGIPISIRPWWGSRRTTRTMYHRECGGVIYPIVREALVLGLNVKRQGDWYFIPTDREPKLHKRGCRVHAATPSLQNNRLYRGAPLVWNRQTNHTGGLVVYQTVQKMPYTIPFVRGNVRAPDHPTLHLKSWHMAIRSRSTSAGSSDGPTLD